MCQILRLILVEIQINRLLPPTLPGHPKGCETQSSNESWNTTPVGTSYVEAAMLPPGHTQFICPTMAHTEMLMIFLAVLGIEFMASLMLFKPSIP